MREKKPECLLWSSVRVELLLGVGSGLVRSRLQKVRRIRSRLASVALTIFLGKHDFGSFSQSPLPLSSELLPLGGIEIMSHNINFTTLIKFYFSLLGLDPFSLAFSLIANNQV